MFERFTDQARRVVVRAQEEARLLKHNYIGTEHILLGLIREDGGVAADVLAEMGIGLEAVRLQVGAIIGQGERDPKGHIPFTPRAKKVLEMSLREARGLGNDYIGAEHILLGLIREGDGVACQVLSRLGASHDRVRALVMERTGSTSREERPTPEEREMWAAQAREAREGTWLSGAVPRFGSVWRTSGNLERLDARLARIEQRLGITTEDRPPGLRRLDEQLAALRSQLEAAIDEGEFESARELRDQERRMRAARDMREHDWRISETPVGSVFEDLAAAREKLAAAHAELTRLAQLLHKHGINPGEPATEDDEPPEAPASEG